MKNYCRNLESEALIPDRLEPGLDGELALHTIDAAATMVPARDEPERFFSRLVGRTLYGRSFQPMTALMAQAVEAVVVAGSKKRRILVTKAMRHARFALRHAALARAALLTLVMSCILVATVILAHETRNTESIYQSYLDNPSTAREPEQSWGYTPLLYDLPEGMKSSLIVLDRFVESRFRSLGLGQSKSASSSVHSVKLGAVLMSLFGLIPLAQFGLDQAGKARLRADKAALALASARAA